jgi:hypothetical protein
VRQELGEQIGGLETELNRLASGYLPARTPSPWSPEADLARLLRDERGRSLRILGEPVLQRNVGVALDELLAELEREACGCSVSGRPEDLLTDLAGRIRQVQQLRGRGGRYGAIRNGIELEVARHLAHDEANTWLAFGALEQAAGELHAGIDTQLCRPAESERLDVLRRLYFRLADLNRPDEAFAEIFVDIWLVEFVMMDSRRPRWCTWRRLAADYLGILPNVL